MKKLIITSFLLAAFSITAYAQTTITKTQVNQQKRIHQGIRNGEITKYEARQLRNQQAHIQRDKRIAKADGFISKGERKYIKREQQRASKNIYRMKHNKRNRA